MNFGEKKNQLFPAYKVNSFVFCYSA